MIKDAFGISAYYYEIIPFSYSFCYTLAESGSKHYMIALMTTNFRSGLGFSTYLLVTRQTTSAEAAATNYDF